MFEKLRTRLILMNLLIITILMVSGFSAIFLFTYKDIRSRIDMELHRIADFQEFGDGRPSSQPNRPNPSILEQNRSLSFILFVNDQWQLLRATSFFEAEENFYDTAIDAFLKERNSKVIEFDGSKWSYLVKSNNTGYHLVFLDVTSQYAMLTRLIYTFLVATAIMLLFIFLISRFLTDRSIRPVKEAYEKQNQFVGDASHELKTPLAVINTNVDVLLDNQASSIADPSKWLKNIQSETYRMDHLVHDLLFLTQMDQANPDLIYNVFDLSHTIENALLSMEAILYEKGLKLNHQLESSIKIYGNHQQILQVIMILLDNAIKYTSEKGSIHLNLQRHSQHAIVTITNTGDGIPKEHIDRIFDRFYRVDASRSRSSGGYGLGLAIAKSIIEQHRGRISVSSIPNESTTFMIKLNTL
ncbi:MAG: two-component sensor histidine kinase [Firmicutes bacterium HGW-Firmicutes-5]|nr:MAG: two-component sensor histidine kinase [Firmicutes bacterium HGW-Firmicutes-5]